MPAAIIRFYAEDHKKNDIGHLLGSSLGVVGIAMLVCSLLFLLLPSLFFIKLSDVQTPFTFKILITLAALAECFTLIAMSIFRAQDKAVKFTLIAVCSALFLILFTLLFLPVLNQRLSGALMARCLTYGSIGLVMTYLLLRFNALKFSMEKAWEVFRFGYPVAFSGLGWFILLSSDRYFLAYFSGMHEVGIYSLGCKLTFFLLVLVVWPFELTYGPFVFANMDHREMKKMMSRLLTYLVLSLIVVGYLIAFLSRGIIQLIAPEEYEYAYIVTICMLPATALRGIHFWSNAQLHIMKKTPHIALVIGVAAFLNLVLGYLLIPKYSWVGAVIATNISSLVAVGTLAVIGSYAFPVKLELRRLVIAVAVSAILCFSYLMTHTLRSHYFYLVNSGVLLAIPAFLYFMRFFDSNEKHFLINLLAFKRGQR